MFVGYFASLVFIAQFVTYTDLTDGSSDVYDTACVRHHVRLMTPDAAFAGDAAMQADFDAAWSAGTMAQGDIDQPTLRAWAEALLLREGKSVRGLRLEPLHGGCRNAGVFIVHTDAGSYVAKRSTRMFEPVRWLTLQMHLDCYPREADVRDNNPFAVVLPGDEARRARIMPLLAWDYSFVSPASKTLPQLLPNMLFEHARGGVLEVPEPKRLDSYTAAEQETFLRRAYALGVSLGLLQIPSLQGSSRVDVFRRTTWMHDDLHLGNMFYDEASERIELVDCIEMRRSSGWDKDLRGLVLHRFAYPVAHPLRQAWSHALALGYLSRTTGRLQDELRQAFAGTLIYTQADVADASKRSNIW